MKRVSFEIKKKNFLSWSKDLRKWWKRYASFGLIWPRTMGGSIFRRYRDRSRINNAHDVGKHWSFPCSWKLQSNYRVKVGNSIFDEGQETIHLRTCGPGNTFVCWTLVGILDRIWMRLRFLNNKIILPGTDLYNSYIIARTVRAF